ncbi:hypothetical protein CU098_005179 [Rhizopus stolonifer]|uniref:Ras GEF n=2 Tax=Mucorineae TaxID=1344963 RepID=A0A367JIG5_RHIST|nr:hypothetical protein CU098_005179 [Rhizopus stolonifer]
MGSEISEFSASIPTIFQKVQRDANDVLVAVRNFVTLCQQRNVTVSFVNPRLLDDITQLPYDPPSTATNNHCKTNTNGPSIERNHSSKSINAEEKKGFLTHSTELNTSLVQKAKYLLNQDLVLNLQAYSHQIYGSTEELSLIGSAVLKKAQKETSVEFHEERTNAVSMFRSLSSQISQYIGVLDEISLDSIDLHAPSISNYRISRQSLYTAIGQLFGAIQTLTDIHVSLGKAVQTINQSIVSVEDAIRSIEQSVVDMVNERKRTMGAVRDDFITVSPTASSIIPIRKPSVNDNGTSHFDHQGQLSPRSQDGFSELDGSEFGMRRGTIASFVSSNNSIVNSFKGTGDLASRMRQQSIRTDDRSFESNDVLGNDHHPDEIEFGSDNTVKGGTLAALVERLTIHDTLDTNFIATFLLTYRSFCTTEEFVSLLEARYNLLPPDRLTPNELEIWTERKQKLIRLRVFNVMKNWLENYYIDEDEPLLGRLEHFTNTNIRDTSSFAANQLLNLIKKRIELSSRGEMKKIIPNAISGPDPIYPKNMANIQLLETDPLEMARQLSILDFKLYSSIRPIELLGKAWSREGADGSVAINIKQSIQYCNQMTAWVTDSILSYEEAKKRAIVIKYWVQVADHCRSMNNFNTCMAILSAFDNSAVGRLKKTWMASSRSTTQTLAQIRKLMGANRNFADYREIVHSVNPPCIPFLGIYLQDLTFIEDGNPDFLPKCNNLINFAKRQKAAEVIRELKQFQNFAYNFHTIPEMQDFIKAYLDITHDVEQLYERSLQLEPRTTEVQAAVNNIMTNIV